MIIDSSACLQADDWMGVSLHVSLCHLVPLKLKGQDGTVLSHNSLAYRNLTFR